MSESKQKIDLAVEKFLGEFERFNNLSSQSLALSDAEGLLKELGELRIRHTGKKSEMAGLKKLIGQVAPEERAGFGQVIQAAEAKVTTSLDEAEGTLKSFIENAK